MIRCPQCGAQLQVAEQELHPTCPYCGTAFLLDGPVAARHLVVPFVYRRRGLLRIAGDYLVRMGFARGGAAPVNTDGTEIQTFFFPYRRGASGETHAAFETHVPELAAFSIPGSDLKIFDPKWMEAGDVVMEPTVGELGPDEALIHYPFARLSLGQGDADLVLWLDAGLGRVVAANLSDFPPAGPGTVARQLLTGVAAAYAGMMLVLPLPWSLGACLLATPLLYRGGLTTVRKAR